MIQQKENVCNKLAMCGDLKKWHEIHQNKLEDDDQSITNYQQWQSNKESGRLEKAVLQGTV